MVVGYIKTQKSIYILYASNEQAKTESRHSNIDINTLKYEMLTYKSNETCIWFIWRKYKTLVKDIKVSFELSKWRKVHIHGWEDTMFSKCHFSPYWSTGSMQCQ